jgi:hypothetical protein
MARAGSVSAPGLKSALSGGHRMSPITLSDAQIDALMIYIGSLK